MDVGVWDPLHVGGEGLRGMTQEARDGHHLAGRVLLDIYSRARISKHSLENGLL